MITDVRVEGVARCDHGRSTNNTSPETACRASAPIRPFEIEDVDYLAEALDVNPHMWVDGVLPEGWVNVLNDDDDDTETPVVLCPAHASCPLAHEDERDELYDAINTGSWMCGCAAPPPVQIPGQEELDLGGGL